MPCLRPLFGLTLLLTLSTPAHANGDAVAPQSETQVKTSLNPETDGAQVEAATPNLQSTLTQIRQWGQAGSIDAFDDLMALMAKSPDAQVQGAALAALSKLNYTPEYLMGVVTGHENAIARSYAAFTLGRMRSDAALPALITALGDENEHVREHAMGALGAIGNPKALQPLIKSAHKDPSPSLRARAEKEAGRIASPDGAYVNESELFAQLKADNPIHRRDAAAKLGKVGSWWAVNPLIETLTDPHPEVRERAIASLGELGDQRATAPLLAHLNQSKGKEAYLTMASLSLLKDQGIREAIEPYLKSPDAHARRAASRSLAELGDPAATAALEGVYPGELVADLRQEYLRTLGILGSESALDTLERAIFAKEIEKIQIQGVWALKTIAGDGALNLLIKTLDHERPLVRASAIDVLVERDDAIHNTTVVEAIRTHAQNESDAYAREAALEALVTLQGRGRRAPKPGQ